MTALLAAVIGSALLATLSPAKPDKVGSINVPFDRIAQEVENNRWAG